MVKKLTQNIQNHTPRKTDFSIFVASNKTN